MASCLPKNKVEKLIEKYYRYVSEASPQVQNTPQKKYKLNACNRGSNSLANSD
jgi:hypothetical protein